MAAALPILPGWERQGKKRKKSLFVMPATSVPGGKISAKEGVVYWQTVNSK